MARKYLFLSILLLVLMPFVMIGCSSTPTEATPTQAEPTPTSDLSIVWSDDFEDEDKEGWKDQLTFEISFVSDGVLTTGPDSGCEISPESIVSRGTWSFDLFYPEEPDNIVMFYQFCLTCD